RIQGFPLKAILSVADNFSHRAFQVKLPGQGSASE
ncbi:MAG: hypothetical protein ACI9B8_001652, partial [Sulfitobacter sp.]